MCCGCSFPFVHGYCSNIGLGKLFRDDSKMIWRVLPAENFDAGQYAFFGKESLEGLDLGCLEDGGGDGNGGGFSGQEEGLYRLSSVGEEVGIPEPSHPRSGYVCYKLSSRSFLLV